MVDMVHIFSLLIGLFALFVVARWLFGWRICALCVSVSGTWIVLLGYWYWRGVVDTTLLGVLMGGSVVGSMYALFAKLPAQYSLFKFPYLIAGLYAVYALVSLHVELNMLWLLLGVWGVFGLLFMWRNNQRIRGAAEQLIACCKNW